MSTVNTLYGAIETLSPIVGAGIANGYLIMRLSTDAIVNGTTLVCAGYTIQINLDSLGFVIVSPNQNVWPNDAMTPSTAGYHVSAYTANGQIVWGPNLIQVLSSPSPFNIGTWIPS
jgi:hypothetical protein